MKKKIKNQTNINSEQKIEKENNLKDLIKKKPILSQEEAVNN